MMRGAGLAAWLGALLLLSSLACPSGARAQGLISPDAGRAQTYHLLHRDPWKAVGYDALLPGAGSVYVRLYGNAVVSAVLSFAGVALWVHGGVRDVNATYWSGVALFAAGRTYGVVSAGVGARMLNRALKRQLQLGLSPTGLRLRF